MNIELPVPRQASVDLTLGEKRVASPKTSVRVWISLWVNIELPVPRQVSVDLTLGEY